MDADRNRLYVVDALENRVHWLNLSTGAGGIYANYSGAAGYSGDGDHALYATFRSPKGVGLDGDGNLYISDFGNHVIRRIDVTDGDTVSTVAGNGTQGSGGDGGPATLANLRFPWDGVIDAGGNLIIADYGNNRVRRVHRVGVPNLPWPGENPVEIPDGQIICAEGRVDTSIARCPSSWDADPVNTANGSFTHSETDVTLPGGAGMLEFARTYNSANTAQGVMGLGWASSFSMHLDLAAAPDEVTWTGDDGQQVTFTDADSDGDYEAGPGVYATLVRHPDATFTLTSKAYETHDFDTAGRLVRVRDVKGQGQDLTYDTDGDLDVIADTFGRSLDVTTDSAGRPIEIGLVDGRSVTYTYTGDGQLETVTDAAGATTTYTYDADGRMTQITDANGHTDVANTYDPVTGRVSSQTDALGNVSTFAWDEASGTSTMTDARGGEWTDVYDGNALVRTVDPLGAETTITYDTDLNPIVVRDPLGSVTFTAYDGSGNVMSVVTPAGTEAFTYDGLNRPLTHTDGRGLTTTFAYDGSGNLVSVTAPDATTTGYGYDGRGLVTQIVDAAGRVTAIGYDSAGQATSVTDPLGRTTLVAHDMTGRKTVETDPAGRTTTFAYDAADRLTSTTDAAGGVTSAVYDPVGNKLSETDAAGHTTTFAYNDADEVIGVTDPAGAETTRVYDETGRVVSETDAAGATTAYTYDLAGRRTGVKVPGGATSTVTYDLAGHVTSAVEARGNEPGADPDTYRTLFAYDGAGRLVRQTDPLGGVRTTAYDPVGQVTAQTDETGNQTQMAWTPRRQLASVTDALGATTAYTYDAVGNLTAKTDPNGNVTVFGYDAAGQNTTVTRPGGHTWSYTYDLTGNVSRTVDANGDAVDYSYDSLDRLVGVDYTDVSTPDVAYTYDPVGNRTSMTDGEGTQTYEYDAADRLLRTSRGSDSFAYTHDPAGRITRRTYPNGTTVDQTWNARGELTQVQAGTDTVSYGYDPAGHLTGTVLGNGVAEARTWDSAGRVSRVENILADASTLSSFDYTYDPAGAPTGRSAVQAGATTDTTWAYDARRRLSSECQGAGCPGGQTTWAYDSVGNRTAQTGPAGTTTYSYDGRDALTSRTGPSGTTPSVSDANGNLTGDGARSYGYDAAGRLVSVTQPAESGGGSGGGPAGATVSFNVSSFIGLPIYMGSVTVSDAAIGSVNTPLFFARVNTPAAGQAAATHSWFKIEGLTLKGYTLAWTVTDNGTSGDEVSVRFSGGINFEDAGTAGSGNVTVTRQTSMFGPTVRVTGSATIGGTATETITYAYDGDGNRLTKTGPEGTTRYHWDTNGRLARLAVEDRPGTDDDRAYVWGRGIVAAQIPSGTLYYSRDALGNITETTDESGAVVATYGYDAWGNDTETLTGPDGPENPFRFTGEYLDADTGLYNLRARQYDPATGRFTQTDPLPQPVDQPCETSYAYAKNRPTALVDPTGKRCEDPDDGVGDDTAELVGGLASAAAFEAYLLLMSTMALPVPSVAYLAPVIVLAAATTALVIAQPAAAATAGGDECGCGDASNEIANTWRQSEFQGRRVYQRDDLFDPNRVSSWRRSDGSLATGTNVERMAAGKAPIGYDDVSVNIHHMIQQEPGPVAEVAGEWHNKNRRVLDMNCGPSWRNDPELKDEFAQFREDYWRNRAKDFM